MSTGGTSAGNDAVIALVTVLFNCKKYLQLFFDCLHAQTDRGFRVIVVDNASVDASLEHARSLARDMEAQCEFIANGTNLGIAVANNQGIERALELGIEHVVLINNDTGFDSDLIANIRRRAIGQGHRAWTCLAYHGDSDVRWYGGGRLSYWLARGIHFDQVRSVGIDSPVAVTYAPTCLMYLHASVFVQVGMMDPQYFVYYDDTDFCKRMQACGTELVYDPVVTFRHYVGGSSGGDLSDFFVRISTRNKFIYIRKHYRYPLRVVVAGLALASKLVQLVSRRRRRSTLLGLRDAFDGARGRP
jgi:GT2 family glycosyltransferase